MENSKISWTTHTFNPWWGCSKVSEGCRNCYAEALSDKTGYGPHIFGEGKLWGKDGARPRTEGPWKDVQKWNRQALSASERPRVFMSSMSDFFEDHEEVVELRREAWRLIRDSVNLDFLVLTKRPENIEAMLPDDWGEGYENVWLGTSIENMPVAHRADILREIPAVVRFISYEPALGPLDEINLEGIDWVIFGGESGSNFREADLDWSRRMRDKCRREGVSFFHKQASGFKPGRGEKLDGEVIHEYPSPRIIEMTISAEGRKKAG